MQHPEPISNPVLNYIILGIAMVFEGGAWLFAFRGFTKVKGKWGYIESIQHAKDPSIFIVLFEDSAAMLGLMVAFIGIALSQYTGIALLDVVASIIIGLILLGTSIWLAYETKGLLIGKSAYQTTIISIKKTLIKNPIVEHVNEVLTMHMGPDYILANISVDFKNSSSAENVENAVSGLSARIKQDFPQIKRIFIEAEKRTAVN